MGSPFQAASFAMIENEFVRFISPTRGYVQRYDQVKMRLVDTGEIVDLTFEEESPGEPAIVEAKP